jgi:hypothetical protein
MAQLCGSNTLRYCALRGWLVSFMQYDLGFFDQEENRVEPVGHNPFASKTVTHVLGIKCLHLRLTD